MRIGPFLPEIMAILRWQTELLVGPNNVNGAQKGGIC